jgi:hypothetical protein
LRGKPTWGGGDTGDEREGLSPAGGGEGGGSTILISVDKVTYLSQFYLPFQATFPWLGSVKERVREQVKTRDEQVLGRFVFDSCYDFSQIYFAKRMVTHASKFSHGFFTSCIYDSHSRFLLPLSILNFKLPPS